MNWSQPQQAVFAHTADEPKQHLEVTSVAGSGKTTTILESIKHAFNKHYSYLYLAFNKAIQVEMEEKVRAKFLENFTTVKTLHSLGYGMVAKSVNQKLQVNSSKVYEAVSERLEGVQPLDIYNKKMYITQHVLRIVKNIRTFGIVNDIEGSELTKKTLESVHETLTMKMVRRFPGIDPLKIDSVFETVRQIAFQVIHQLDADTSPIVDFDDMVRRPYVQNLITRLPYHTIFIDEAQDLNEVQIETIKRLSEHSRIIYVGDRKQAIYHFRGSDEKSMDKLQQALNPKIIKLGETFRTSSNIIDFVNEYVFNEPVVESNLEGGTVEPFGTSARLEDVTGDYDVLAQVVGDSGSDFIITPRNKDMFNLWVSMFVQGIKANMKDKSVINSMIKFLEQYPKEYTFRDLLTAFSRELEDLRKVHYETMKRRRDPGEELPEFEPPFQYEVISDFVGSEHFIKMGFSEDSNIMKMQEFFQEIEASSEGINLHTVHSAKGLEAGHVVVLDNRWFGDNYMNLRYVSYTRAINKLSLMYLIEDDMEPEPDDEEEESGRITFAPQIKEAIRQHYTWVQNRAKVPCNCLKLFR